MYASLRVTTPPASEPVTVDLARQHCRIDADYDDAFAGDCTATSARIEVQADLNRALFTQHLRFAITWRRRRPRRRSCRNR